MLCAGSAPTTPSRRPGLPATATCWPSRSRAGKATASRLLNVRTRRLQVVWSEEVLADYLAWEADGSGVYYYRAVEKERVGVAGDSGLVVAEHSYALLTPSFHPLRAGVAKSRASEEVASHTLPAGFPILNKPAAEELSEPVVEEVGPGTPSANGRCGPRSCLRTSTPSAS